MKNMKKMNNKGFSLVELIIVIAIMAILAGALAPALLRYIEKTRVSNDKTTAGNLKMAVETALTDEDVMDEVTSVATAATGAGVPSGAKFLLFEIDPASNTASGSADYSAYTATPPTGSTTTLLESELIKTIPSRKLVIKSKKDLQQVYVVAIALGGSNQADVVEVYLQEAGGAFVDTQGNKLSASPTFTDLIN